MRGYVTVMMAERQACLDDLAAYGFTPAVYGSSGASGPPPAAHEPTRGKPDAASVAVVVPLSRPAVPAPRRWRGCRAGQAAANAIVRPPGAGGPQLGYPLGHA
jgi:hypothetical protein